MGEVKEIGNVMLYDPNDYSIDNNGLDFKHEIMKDPEDYNIAVDLVVTIRDKTKVNKGSRQLSLIGKSTKVGILQGEKLGGSNVLTDFFSNLGDNSPDAEPVDEALCVKNIDIEFSSWYAATVTIDFTDVRGEALFSDTERAEKSKDTDGNITNENTSLFRSFFAFPYPIYTLKVKGFYGKAVLYPLHHTDFRAEFDSNTGNFNVKVTFIGYTYAMMNDLEISYLMAAPYCSKYGREYWENNMVDGRFLSSDGNRLPTLIELISKVKNAQYSNNKLKNTEERKKEAIIQEKRDFMNSIVDNIKLYISQYSNFKTNYKIDLEISESNNIVELNIENKQPSFDNFSKFLMNFENLNDYKPIKDILTNILKDIKHFNTKFSDTNVFYNIQNINNFKPVFKNTTNSGLYKYKIDFSELYKNIETQNTDLSQTIELNKKELESAKSTNTIDIYGFTPNIFNYTKIIIAHMETLFHIINETIKSIEQKTIRGERNFTTIGNLSIEQTDINNGDILTPFPNYSEKNDEDVFQDKWIGDVFNNLDEVDTVEKMLSAMNEIENSIIKINSGADGLIESEAQKNEVTTGQTTNIEILVSDDKIWLPINPFDNPINLIGGQTYAPYDNVKNIADIEFIFLNRLYQMCFLSFIDEKYVNSYAFAEYKNIESSLLTNGLTNEFKELFKNNGAVIIKNLKRSLNNGYYEKNVNRIYLKNDKIDVFSLKNEGASFKIINDPQQFIDIKTNYLDKIEKEVNKKDNEVLTNLIKNWNIKNPKDFTEDSSKSGCCVLNKICEKRIEFDESKYGSSDGLKYKNYEDIKYLNIIDGKPNMGDIKLNSNGIIIANSTPLKDLNKIYGKTEISNNFLIEDAITNNNNNYTYPLIGGLTNENVENKDVLFSLFGHELYYRQKLDTTRAFLFLQTIDIDINKIEDEITKVSGDKLTNELNKFYYEQRSSKINIFRKVGILMIGGLLYNLRKNNSKNKYNIDKNQFYLIPDQYSYFKQNGSFYIESDFIQSQNSTHISKKYLKSNLFYFDGDGDGNKTSKLKSNEEKIFIDIFIAWVNSNGYDGWQTIKKNLEIPFKTGKSVKTLIRDMSQRIKDEINNTTPPTSFIGNFENINNFQKNYVRLSIDKNMGYPKIIMLNRDGSDGVNSVLNLLSQKSLVFDIGNIGYGLYNITKNISIKENIANNVIRKLSGHILNIKQNNVGASILSTTNAIENKISPNIAIPTSDMKLMTYSYLKLLYDKWVSGFDNENDWKWITKVTLNNKKMKSLPNTVGNYYIKNFRFVDRAHIDIGNKLIINYENAVSSITNANNNKTMFSVLTDMLQQNDTLFIPLPSYSYFDSKEELSEIFQPYPYIDSDINNINTDDNSIFICTYIGKPSSKSDLGNSGKYKTDVLDFNKEKLSSDFYKGSDKIPAITVNFSTQNQAYFKNISLNQSSPNITDASIKAIQNIANKANQQSAQQQIGQDMFSVYSSYAYTCSVDMLGCPQMQPMMYFQLNNIPMFNGAYIIYKTKHSIKPGHMTTNFTGMRMASSYPKLMDENMLNFTLSNIGGYTDINLGDAPTEESDYIIKSYEGKIKTTKDKFFSPNDHFNISDYFKGKSYTSDSVSKKMFERVKYTAKYVEYIYLKWKENNNVDFIITNGAIIKFVENNKKSAHLIGLAVDLQLINPTKENNELFFNFIIDLMRSGLKIDQIINEKDSGYFVHIGVGHHTNGDKVPVVIKNKYETRGILSKEINETDSYNNYGTIEEAKWPSVITEEYKITSSETKTNIINTAKILKGFGLSKVQIAGIMGNISEESKFNPKIPNVQDKNGGSYGLIQFNAKWHGGTLQSVQNNVGTTVASQLEYLNNNMPTFKTFINNTRSLSDSNENATKCAYEFAKTVEVCGGCTEGETIFKNKHSLRITEANKFYSSFLNQKEYLYWNTL